MVRSQSTGVGSSGWVALERIGEREASVAERDGSLVPIGMLPGETLGARSCDGVGLVVDDEAGAVSGERAVWAVRRGDETIGLLRVDRLGEALAELRWARVDPAWRASGLVAALVRFAMAWAHANGCWRVMIGPDADAPPVRRLAGEMGWQCLFPPDHNVMERLRRAVEPSHAATPERGVIRRRTDPSVGSLVSESVSWLSG